MPTTSFLPGVVTHDLFLPNSAVIFCHSWIALVCLIYLYLPNLYFYTIRSMMFLKVLSKVDIREFILTQIISYYWLTPVCKTVRVGLKGGSFLFLGGWSSPMFWLFYNLHECALPTQLSWMTRSGLAPCPGCQGSCGIVPNGPVASIVSFNIHQGLKCKHVASTPTLTMWLLCSKCLFLWTTK